MISQTSDTIIFSADVSVSPKKNRCYVLC